MAMTNEIRNAIMIASTLLALLIGIGQFMFFSRADGQVIQNEVTHIKTTLDRDLGRIEDKLDKVLGK
jgi:hypothetical protein